jgi:hypothetical protein
VFDGIVSMPPFDQGRVGYRSGRIWALCYPTEQEMAMAFLSTKHTPLSLGSVVTP